MAWQLVNGRRPEKVEELSPLEREQLFLAGKAFDGMERPAELRFVELEKGNPYDVESDEDDDEDDDWWDDGCLSKSHLSIWRVLVDGRPTYDLWVHHSDNGSLFKAGTTELVAGRTQSCWLEFDGETDWPNASLLDEAMKDAEVW